MTTLAFTTWTWRDRPEYRCSSQFPEGSPEWVATGHVDVVFGIYSIIYASVCELLYFPCMLALFKETRNSCYKIMFWLSIVDMIALTANSFSFGIFLLGGRVFCSSPDIIWAFGCIGLGAWCGACSGCLLLVVNRLCEMLNKSRFFERRRVWYMLCFTTCYGLFFGLFTRPVLFNSSSAAMFFDPYITVPAQFAYTSYLHTANNLIVVACTSSLYGVLCVVVVTKQGIMSTEAGKARTAANAPIFLQAALICSFNLLAAIIYVYMNFFPSPREVIILGHIAWQLSHGAPPFIYLFLNRAVRRQFKQLFCRWPGGNNRQRSQASTVTHTRLVTTLSSLFSHGVR